MEEVTEPSLKESHTTTPNTDRLKFEVGPNRGKIP